VCLVRFMVESPAQSGRLRTLIHPGPVSGVHVTYIAGKSYVLWIVAGIMNSCLCGTDPAAGLEG
jgi:hypothetical protein